jgi:hypothetical protein
LGGARKKIDTYIKMPPKEDKKDNKMAGKGYYYDNSKDRFVARMTMNGKRHHIGNFKTPAEAEEAVKNFLIEKSKEAMPARRRGANRAAEAAAEDNKFTLEDAYKYFDTLPNAEKSKQIWQSQMTNLVVYAEGDEASPLTTKEFYEKHKGKDIGELIADYEKVMDIIENKIRSKTTDQPIALDTRRQYVSGIVRLTQKSSPLKIAPATRSLYISKERAYHGESNDRRDESEPTKGNLLNPELTWTRMREDYDKWVAVQPFTNTEKGRKDLKTAIVAGLYILHKPRRVADYATLQVYSKLPNKKDRETKNILHVERDKMTMYINVFKTRWTTRGGAKKRTEQMPEYVKEVQPALASLFKDYIKKAQIKDMSKRTPAQVRDKEQYYIFAETRTQLADDKAEDNAVKKIDNAFSKTAVLAFKAVFVKPDGTKREGVSVNTIRHAWNTWRVSHFNEFSIKQHREWQIEVGDTPKQYPTADRYQIRNQDNVGLTKSEVVEAIEDQEYVKGLMEAAAEGEGSVMGGTAAERRMEQMEVIDELDGMDESELVEVVAIERDSRGNVGKEGALRRIGQIEVEIRNLTMEKEKLLAIFS